jgi:hypothetical protein
MAGTASGDKMDWDDEMKKKAQEAIAAYTARRIQATSISSSSNMAFNTSSGSNLGLGQLTVQSPVTPTITTAAEPEVPTWDSVVAAAFGWAVIDPAKAGVMLEIAKEIRKHEDQEAKLFKRLRKQLELEAADDGDS